MGRLVLETESGSSPISANITKAYSFDERGNRSGMVVSGAGENYTESYSYDLNNRLLSSQKISGAIRQNSVYGYDANGNRVSRESEMIAPIGTAPERLVGFGLEGPGIEKLSYNGLNQLTSVQLDGQTVGSYTYRPSGLRHSKTTAAGTTVHLWEGSYIVADETDGVITGTYLRGIGLVATEQNNTLTYQVYNGHGDVVQLAGEDSSVDLQYDYDAYGNQREITGQDTTTPDTNPFRYSGEYFDLSSGTYYLRNRNYDPAIGGFTSEDPIRHGLNWYAYCAGNPIMFIDPFGLASVSFTDYIKAQGGIVSDIFQRDGRDMVSVTVDGATSNWYLNSGKMDDVAINTRFGFSSFLTDKERESGVGIGIKNNSLYRDIITPGLGHYDLDYNGNSIRLYMAKNAIVVNLQNEDAGKLVSKDLETRLKLARWLRDTYHMQFDEHIFMDEYRIAEELLGHYSMMHSNSNFLYERGRVANMGVFDVDGLYWNLSVYAKNQRETDIHMVGVLSPMDWIGR